MPDLDEYEPLARQWRPLYEGFQQNTLTSMEIADKALRIVTKMLRNCGGCILLSEMTNIVWQHQLELMPETLFSQIRPATLVMINHELRNLAKESINKRIDCVALRSAQTVATKIYANRLRLDHPQILQTHIASQVVKDIIRHSFLDKARATAINTRFSSGLSAYETYQQIISHIDKGMENIVKQLIKQPDGHSLRYQSLLVKKSSTQELLTSTSIF